MPHAPAVCRDVGGAAGSRYRFAGPDSVGGGAMRKSLDGAAVLVTGGTGLIGSHIVDQLIDQGAARVRVLDNLVRGRIDNIAGAMRSGRVTFQEGDVRDRDAVRRAVDGC